MHGLRAGSRMNRGVPIKSMPLDGGGGRTYIFKLFIQIINPCKHKVDADSSFYFYIYNPLRSPRWSSG